MGDVWLKKIFHSVDKDGSGLVNDRELQQVLSNGTHKPFNIVSIRLMIELFDTNRKGSLDYDEFRRLWKFVDEWLKCYQSFDRDHSGNISREEFQQALAAFGYRLSDNFYNYICGKFTDQATNRIIFDDFIYVCCSLQRFTETFRRLDKEQTGTAKVDYDGLLCAVFENIQCL